MQHYDGCSADERDEGSGLCSCGSWESGNDENTEAGEVARSAAREQAAAIAREHEYHGTKEKKCPKCGAICHN